MIIDRYIMSVHSLKLLRPLNRQWQSVTLPTYIQLRHASSSGRQETSQYPHIFYSSMTPPLQVETISPVSIKVHRGALRAPLEMGPSEKEPSGAQELWHFGRMGTHGDLTWADLRDICIHLLVLHRCSVFFFHGFRMLSGAVFAELSTCSDLVGTVARSQVCPP